MTESQTSISTDKSLHIDDVNVTIAVTVSYVIELGLYSGPITKAMLAEHINRLNDETGTEQFIDKVQVIDMHNGEGTCLVEGAFSR